MSLIELLLYMAVFSMIVLVISSFLFSILRSQTKNQTIAEVEQQGVLAMERITQLIRNAEGINSPSIGESDSEISIDMSEAGLDPTIINLSGDTLYMKEGAGSPIELTNSNIIVTDLTFFNLSRSDAPGNIRIEFTISHVNPEGRNEYEFEKTFAASTSLR